MGRFELHPADCLFGLATDLAPFTETCMLNMLVFFTLGAEQPG
jgi:hypothetical protein